MKPIYTGSETNIQVMHESELQAPQEQSQGVAQTTNAHAPSALAQAQQPARLRIEPQNPSLKVGGTATVRVAVDNVSDLFSIPFLLLYDPTLISVEDVEHGDFLQSGGQPIAIVLQVDKEHGEAVLSATRQPNTRGVSGSGAIMDIVIKGLAPGASALSIVRVSARDSQQRPIPLVTNKANVQVEP